MKERYEMKKKTVTRFWEIITEGNTIIVRYGRGKTKGQVHIKRYASNAEASKARIELGSDKIRQGFILVPSPKT